MVKTKHKLGGTSLRHDFDHHPLSVGTSFLHNPPWTPTQRGIEHNKPISSQKQSLIVMPEHSEREPTDTSGTKLPFVSPSSSSKGRAPSSRAGHDDQTLANDPHEQLLYSNNTFQSAIDVDGDYCQDCQRVGSETVDSGIHLSSSHATTAVDTATRDDDDEYQQSNNKRKQSYDENFERTRFQDVIGHSAVKLRMEEMLLPMALPSNVASQVLTGIRALPASILLYGPPGCGKVSIKGTIYCLAAYSLCLTM